MLSGTSCRFSLRFCAVTMTCSSTPLGVASCAKAGAERAVTTATAREFRLSLRCRLRVIVVSPIVMYRSVSQRSPASNLRYVRIVLQYGAERAFQRSQPGLVVAPVVDTLAIDRPAHLLGAGRADCT